MAVHMTPGRSIPPMNSVFMVMPRMVIPRGTSRGYGDGSGGGVFGAVYGHIVRGGGKPKSGRPLNLALAKAPLKRVLTEG